MGDTSGDGEQVTVAAGLGRAAADVALHDEDFVLSMHRGEHVKPRFWTGVLPGFGLWGAFAALALIAALDVFAPLPQGASKALYDVVGAGSVGLGFLGLRRKRPSDRNGWLLVLIGYAGWVVGDLVWTSEQYLMPGRYPAPSDAFYLSSYLVLGVGALRFGRVHGNERDLAAALDALIITVGVGMLVGAFVIAPLAGDSSLSLAAKIVSSAYPLSDLFLVGVIARLYAAPGARPRSYQLLGASLVLTLSADLVYDVVALVSGNTASSRWTDGLWLVGYLLAGVAACIPVAPLAVRLERMAREPAMVQNRVTLTRGRLAGLSGGLLLPGVALLLDGVDGGGVHWPLIGTGMLLLSGLVLARMIGLLDVVQVQSRQLASLARLDHLTGAPNRRSWDHELARACATSRRLGSALSVAILDLDRFKKYNDTHGHPAGDQLLRQAVAAWTAALPERALLARYGGEEFAILVPGSDTAEVAALVGRLRPLTPDGQTFSAGVAAWDPETDPSSVVEMADAALYTAKRAGRDRVIVHGPAETAGLVFSSGHVDALPQFTMVTQPIVDILTLTVTGHEILARFTGPEGARGVEEVFRDAHANGFGDLLELATLRAALELPGRPVGHDLFVNVSARALVSPAFSTGLPTRLGGIVVELTEDGGGIDHEQVADAVAGLRARGARIALDDVGAGTDDFTRLAQLCPDVVKVDRSLVDGCAQNSGSTAVLRGLVAYAECLGLAVCAEGVENIQDLVHLRDLGVTYAQGYLLARPERTWQSSRITTDQLRQLQLPQRAPTS